MLLESHVAGRWRTPHGRGRAAAGRRDRRGGRPDLDRARSPAAEALTHARDGRRSGAARADLPRAGGASLKQLGAHLMAHHGRVRTSCPTPPARPRATRAVDVDGGFGTLLGYAEQGTARAARRARARRRPGRAARPRRHLRRPARHDAAARRRGAGQRLQLPGLGDAREARAGVPRRRAERSSSRPRRRPTSPSWWSGRIVESGILPEGALQLLVGGPDGLLDALDGQDLLGFTGSAATARTAARAPGRGRSAACASPPRPTRSTPPCSAPTPRRAAQEFDLFVREVAREMTAKAGQKCTAIRRAFVPRAAPRRGDRGAARGARRGRRRRPARPGDPDGRAGRAPQQRDAVRDAVGAHRRRRPASSSATPTPASTGCERGAFLPPLLLRHDDPRAPRRARRRGRSARSPR